MVKTSLVGTNIGKALLWFMPIPGGEGTRRATECRACRPSATRDRFSALPVPSGESPGMEGGESSRRTQATISAASNRFSQNLM